MNTYDVVLRDGLHISVRADYYTITPKGTLRFWAGGYCWREFRDSWIRGVRCTNVTIQT